MRFRFYKTIDFPTFWAVRMTRQGTPKMVPGEQNKAYGIAPKNPDEDEGFTSYYAGVIDLNLLGEIATRCTKKDALEGMGEWATLITETGLQFRYSVSSGVYAIVHMREGKPVIGGQWNDHVRIKRSATCSVGAVIVDGFVLAATLHLDKVVSAGVAAKYDPDFVKHMLEKYAAFTA